MGMVGARTRGDFLLLWQDAKMVLERARTKHLSS